VREYWHLQQVVQISYGGSWLNNDGHSFLAC